MASSTGGSFSVLFLHCEMEDFVEEQQQQQTEIIESAPAASVPIPITDETTSLEQPGPTSMVQSLLQEQADETGGKKKKKKKKAKTGRQKELVNIHLISSNK